MELTDSDLRHVIAASGWVDLGLLAEAADELDNITPECRAHPDVLEVRWNIYHAAKKWPEAIEVASGLTRLAPERFAGWWMLSFAMHELKFTREAYENLERVKEQFGSEYLLHYNVACYLTKLGRLEEAGVSLERAFELNPKQRAAALHDPDLEAFWTQTQRS